MEVSNVVRSEEAESAMNDLEVKNILKTSEKVIIILDTCYY